MNIEEEEIKEGFLEKGESEVGLQVKKPSASSQQPSDNLSNGYIYFTDEKTESWSGKILYPSFHSHEAKELGFESRSPSQDHAPPAMDSS